MKTNCQIEQEEIDRHYKDFKKIMINFGEDSYKFLEDLFRKAKKANEAKFVFTWGGTISSGIEGPG